MKEYKLIINGNNYNVVIGDVEETSAMVEVNGTTTLLSSKNLWSNPPLP